MDSLVVTVSHYRRCFAYLLAHLPSSGSSAIGSCRKDRPWQVLPTLHRNRLSKRNVAKSHPRNSANQSVRDHSHAQGHGRE
jgi:hypothetical protein